MAKGHEEACGHCHRTTREFSYYPGKSRTGKKYTLALCQDCLEGFYGQCERCKCMVKKWELTRGSCLYCRKKAGGNYAESNIDKRLLVLSQSALKRRRNRLQEIERMAYDLPPLTGRDDL